MCVVCGFNEIENKKINLFSEEEIEALFQRIFGGMVTDQRLDVDYYIKVARHLMNGVVKGFGKDIINVQWGTPDYEMLKSLRENVYVFSAAKNYQQTREISSLLTKGDSFKQFNDFKKEASKIFNTYNEHYLRAEYNSAIAQARSASNWMEIERDIDFYPQLQYETVGDERVRAEHVALDNIIRPVNDKFWDKYYPPNGWNCYDNKTSIYTDNGWKLFSELTSDDKVMTLNTENFDMEYQKPINYIKKWHNGTLISIKANNFSCVVTDKHKMLVRKNWDLKQKRKKLRLIDADSIAINDQVYKSSEWKGNKIRVIEIANKTWDIVSFVKFMAWYLSEGSTTKRNENVYQIKISQSDKKYLSLIKEDLINIPFNFYVGKDYIGINSKELGEYLIDFGKSFEKYIPKEIKNLSPDLLQLFLDRYIKGDGNIIKGRVNKNGYLTKDIETIFTTSKRMAGDLSEIVIKSGKSCTISERKNKGIEVKHRNGLYKSNNNIFRLNISESQYYNVQKQHISEINYSDFVYCVEVEKYNTLLVMREGKIYWCGNCRCIVIQTTGGQNTPKVNIPKISEEQVPEIFRFNAGKTKQIFSEAHPYFEVAKKDKDLARNNFNLPLP